MVEAGTSADMVVRNADVVTCDPRDTRARAIAVKDGRIAYVGDDRGATRLIGPGTEVIEGRRRVMTPGFIDNHCHVIWIGGMLAMMPDTLIAASNLDETLEMVLEQSRANPDLPYVSGVGWRFENLPEGVPDRTILDRVIPDRPVVLMSLCGQCGWYNTCAIELLEKRNPQALKRLVPNVDPTGAYVEGLNHFHSISPLDFFTPEEMDPVFQTAVPEAISRVLDEAVSVGVTALDDVQIYKSFVPYMLQYRERGVFDKVRLRGGFYVDQHDTEDEGRLRDDLAWWVEMKGQSDDRLTLGQSLKFYSDGTPGNRTAFLLEPYSDDPTTRGRADWSPEDFDRVIEMIDSMGLQACTHVCGDAAGKYVIHAYERAGKVNGQRDSRHRLDHCELPLPEDVEKMAECGMHAAMQPCHYFGDETMEAGLGPERLARFMPWRSLEEAGITVSFGSDWCNSPLNPFYGLLIAGTRRNYKGTTDWGPGEKITVENAVRHWTIDSARALMMEDEIGSLEVGKRADFVLFNKSPLKVTSWWFLLTNKIELGELDDFVDLTIVNGKPVYKK